MTMYQRLKGFYDERRWTKAMLWDGVKAKAITPEEYLKITGELFDPNKRSKEEMKP